MPDYVSAGVNTTQYNIPDGKTPPLGICLGKKWTGELSTFNDEFDQPTTHPILSNWLIFDQYGKPEYPPTGLPNNLPDWVGGYKDRVLIGDGTGSLGPFTLKEVLYIYATARRIVIDNVSFQATISNGHGQQASISELPLLSTGGTVESPPIYHSFPDNYYPFNDNFYGEPYRDTAYYENEDLDQTPAPAYDYARITSYLFIDPNHFAIAIDVENTEDYYLSYRYNTAGIQTEESFFSFRFRGSTVYEDAGDVEIASFSCVISARQYQVYVPDYYNSGVTTEELSPVTCSLQYGQNKTKSFKLYPFINYYGGSRDLLGDRLSINLSSLSLKIEKYWPFANADGQPVYNTTTGEIINNPVP